jgi:hypothetical protein
MFLSGDKTSTSKVEGWDPMFGRWPKWSEGLVYTLATEYSRIIPGTAVPNEGISYWSNISAVGCGMKFNLAPGTDWMWDYTYFGAPELANKALGSFANVGTGKVRGNLIASRLIYKVNSTISGHLVWENFHPGDYYFSGADSFNWVRIEVIATL